MPISGRAVAVVLGLPRWDALAPIDGETAGRVVNDPRRAVTHSGLAERAVVRDEAGRYVIGDRLDKPAQHLDAQAGGTANERLGALARDDPGDLMPLA